MTKYALAVVTDREAEDLLAAWTAEVESWCRRCGHALPMSPPLLHDLTLLAVAFSSAFVAGDLSKQVEHAKMSLPGTEPPPGIPH